MKVDVSASTEVLVRTRGGAVAHRSTCRHAVNYAGHASIWFWGMLNEPELWPHWVHRCKVCDPAEWVCDGETWELYITKHVDPREVGGV